VIYIVKRTIKKGGRKTNGERRGMSRRSLAGACREKNPTDLQLAPNNFYAPFHSLLKYILLKMVSTQGGALLQALVVMLLALQSPLSACGRSVQTSDIRIRGKRMRTSRGGGLVLNSAVPEPPLLTCGLLRAGKARVMSITISEGVSQR
jgi:hypothetical protein